jgi:F-type H+-transporting ATPase subunit c
MKKIALLMLGLAAFAFAGDNTTLESCSVIVAIIGLAIAAFGGAISMGNTAVATINGTARNPQIGGKLMGTMFIALAMIEAQVIYVLVLALIVLYANPFLG